MEKLKISVFGGSGFVGKRFCEIFTDQTIKIPRNKYEPETPDILFLISTVDNYNIYTNPQLDIDTNLKTLIAVLDKCKNKYIDKGKKVNFNFVSSWFVYGCTDPLPAKEENHCDPRGFYSITKRCGEQLLVSYCETFGINYRIFRLANVIGEDDLKVSKRKNALQYLIMKLLNNEDINLYHGGDTIRDYIYVDDVCYAMELCIKKGELNDIVNIGSGIPYKFIDLLGYCKKHLNSNSQFNDIDPTEFHKIVQVKDFYLDITKLNDLKFKQRTSIFEALDKILCAYRDKFQAN